jgi:hypothetical protein
MLYVTEVGCKQLLEMVLMGDSITWVIFHKSCTSGGMNLALNNHHHRVLPISLDNCSTQHMQKWILKQFLIVALLHAPTPPQKI